MNTKHLIKLFIGAFLMTVVSVLSGIVFSDTQNFGFYLWVFFSNFLLALVMGYYILNSILSGWKLTFTVFISYFMIGHFNTLIEALIFNVTTQGETIKYLIHGFIFALLAALIMVYIWINGRARVCRLLLFQEEK